jgi:predicted nucleic acid-binding protein
VPTHLADRSALARLHHDDVAARIGPMLVGGRIATCGVVDLEILLAARNAEEHALIRLERQMFPRIPCGDDAADRALAVRELLARAGHHGIPTIPLLVAAAAELSGLTVLHYDHHLGIVAEVTGQAAEWVVPPGTVP